jgi:hypothetical protein
MKDGPHSIKVNRPFIVSLIIAAFVLVAPSQSRGIPLVEKQKPTAFGGQVHLFDGFGESVALDGDMLLVGAPGDHVSTITGSVYALELVGEEWVQMQKLTASDGGPEDRFGRAVALYGDWCQGQRQPESGRGWCSLPIRCDTRRRFRWQRQHRPGRCDLPDADHLRPYARPTGTTSGGCQRRKPHRPCRGRVRPSAGIGIPDGIVSRAEGCEGKFPQPHSDYRIQTSQS